MPSSADEWESGAEVIGIQPNTKVTYDLNGFIQDIYYEVPVGSGNYQLSPEE